ncbi:MAG: GGDEF domain-containing protein, partial [Fusobacterium sp.]
CLDAVYSGKCDITYCDYLVGNFYFSSYKYQKLFKEYISFENMSSFVLNEDSPLFNSIINKTISSIKEKEISQIVSNNLDYKPKSSYLLNWIYLNSIKAFIIGIILIFIILNIIYYFRINKKNKLIQRVTALSKKDSMTKLYNRDTFEEIVTKLLESENLSKHSAFVMMDIDSFKSINDTYGHLIGDKVIIKVTNLLKKAFKYSDVLGRMGGDEFAGFIYNIDSVNYVNSKIERLIADINNCMIEEKDGINKIVVKCSFGITFIKGEKKTFERIYKEADDALYKAKSDGKNRYIVYNKDNIIK